MRLFILWMSALLAAPSTFGADDVLGYWASEGSIIHVSKHADELSARVFALMDPTYTPEEAPRPVGAVRLDDRNPDPEIRTRPVLGLELLSGYRFSGKRWEGKIYDPESGNTYSSRMERDGDGNLKMRGYVGIPLLGRTAIFLPLSLCTENMRTMLARSEVKTQECAAGD